MASDTLAVNSPCDWLVVPGGPGLSNQYLKVGLAPFFPARRLFFYEALGTPDYTGDKTMSLEHSISQLAQAVADHQLQAYGLITHSFGNYLALEALVRQSIQPQAILMLSPMPLTFNAWFLALSALQNKMPDTAADEIQRLSQKPDQGVALFHYLLPFYTTKPTEPPDIAFDLTTCQTLSAEVNHFDHRAVLKTLPCPWQSLLGTEDPFFNQLTDFPKSHQVLIPGVGHYPFFEDPIAFSNALTQSLTRLSNDAVRSF